MSDAEFERLLAAGRAGDAAALQQIVQRYEPEVRLVARLRLSAALRPHLDSVDLVQSVHRSLMIGLRDGRFDISTPEKLVALALTMVRRKAANHWRHLKRQQRLSGDHDRQNLPDLLLSLHTESDAVHEQLVVRESIDRLLDELTDVDRQLMELRLEGYSTAEVARKLGVDSDVLRVRLSRLRRKIRDLNIISESL